LILSYSNIGMTLLGHAVQEVGGQTYADYISQSLLLPMGMTNSLIAPGLEAGGLNSKGYNESEQTTVMQLRDLPAGALNTTVTDLAAP
jgi:CubicO group peptidase (beta-lactamase class C family)